MSAQPSLILLPQASGHGYYSYASMDRQWGTKPTIDTIAQIAADFVRNQRCEIGIGDMSFRSGGAMPPHVSHTDGRCIDIRPLRTDGAAGPAQITDALYDHAATNLLARSLLTHSNVSRVLFNDPKIPGVILWPGHDNHLHVITKS